MPWKKWLADGGNRIEALAAKKPVKNRDLWERLQVQLDRYSVTLEWVRGHNGHAENERCDEAARSQSARHDLPEDTGCRAGIKRFDAERGTVSKGGSLTVGTAALPFSGRCFQCLLYLSAAPKAPPHNIH